MKHHMKHHQPPKPSGVLPEGKDSGKLEVDSSSLSKELLLRHTCRMYAQREMTPPSFPLELPIENAKNPETQTPQETKVCAGHTGKCGQPATKEIMPDIFLPETQITDEHWMAVCDNCYKRYQSLDKGDWNSHVRVRNLKSKHRQSQ